MSPSSFQFGPLQVDLDFVQFDKGSITIQGLAHLPIDSLNEFLSTFFRPPLRLRLKVRDKSLRISQDGVSATVLLFPVENGVEAEITEVLFFDLIPLRGTMLDLLENTILKFVRVPGLSKPDGRLAFDLNAFFPPFLRVTISRITFDETEITIKFGKKKEGNETERT